jgi:signal transduction histidine kinase
MKFQSSEEAVANVQPASTSFDEQDIGPVRRWTILIATALLNVLILWLIADAFGGINADRPLSLVLASIVPMILFIVALTGARLLASRGRRHILSEAARQATTEIQNTASHASERRDILSTLEHTIQATLDPQEIESALSYTGTDAYHLSSGSTVSRSNPWVAWILDQPDGIPVNIPRGERPKVATPETGALYDRGMRVILPLGIQGWIALSSPSSSGEFTEDEMRFLAMLGPPAIAGLERTSFVEMQQKRSAELQALHWIAQAISFDTTLDNLLELIYTQLARVMTLPNFYIAQKDPDTGEMSFAFYIEDGERRYPEDRWANDEGLTGVVMNNAMTFRTDDYQEACESRGFEPSGPRIGKAWMGTPLNAGERSVGVMVASTFDPDQQFSSEDEDFFITVGAYTGALLERHTLYAQLESRANQLDTLNEIAMLLASSLDLDEVLELVVESAGKLLNAEAGSLLLLDEDTGDLVFQITNGPAGEDLVGMHIPAGRGIAGAAFTENHPVISQNTSQDKRWYANFDKQSEFVTESVLAVPLNARGRSIGVLEVINKKSRHPFTDDDAEVLQAFASQAAIAIENARLFTTTDQALQARLEELTTLQHIDRQLNATLDYNQVMDQTLAWAMRITDATTGAIAAIQESEDGNQGLRFLAQQGYADEDLLTETAEVLRPLDKGLIGQTVTQGTTQRVIGTPNVAQADQELSRRAQLTVPIKREGRVIGVVALESKRTNSFVSENVAFVERLADHAAIAIDNARLFKRVQDANEAKTNFISFVSHELKQPMTSITGYSDLLIKGVGGELNAQQEQFIRVIRNNTDRMNRIVQDLLDISRIESGRLKLEIGPVMPEEVVSEAVQAFEQEIASKSQQIEVVIEDDLPTVPGDRERLIQVLTNLVSNANKYTPENGQITLKVDTLARNGQTSVRWSVQDTGIGMTEEERSQLFTKYFRSQRDAVRSVPGTGLGLVITQSIIEMHGGEVDVESELHKGSTFSFTVPMTPG